MYFLSIGKYAAVVSGVVLFTVGLPVHGFAGSAGRPCTCDDLEEVEDYLHEKEVELNKWQEVRNGWSWNVPAFSEEKPKKIIEGLKEEFLKKVKEAFPDKVFTKVEGLKDGEVEVSPEQEQRCDIISQSTHVHGETHKQSPLGGGYLERWRVAVSFADYEIAAYKAQIEFLKEALEKLCEDAVKKCCDQESRKTKIKSVCKKSCPLEPRTELSTSLSNEQMLARRERLRRAEERVTTYANAIGCAAC